MQILLIGAGAMGGALLKGWDPFFTITVVDPFKENYAKSIEDLPRAYVPDVIIIAVKPQMLATILPPYAKFPSSLFISIAAGVKSQSYLKWLGEETRLIRVMPNLPVIVGEGASVFVTNSNCTPADEAIVKNLFEKVGTVQKLDDESLFDSATALSGSGPAYVYYLCECLETAGVQLGLSGDLASTLARQTIIGAAATLKELPNPPSELRQNVTSPGGTTQAALEVLMKNNDLQILFQKALQAAHERSKELGK